MENEEIVFHPIGYIKSDYKTIEETPKHGFENDFEAEIVIKEEFTEAMADMKENQKFMVLFDIPTSWSRAYDGLVLHTFSKKAKSDRGINYNRNRGGRQHY